MKLQARGIDFYQLRGQGVHDWGPEMYACFLIYQNYTTIEVRYSLECFHSLALWEVES